jgi:hypothetical protein
MPCLLPLSPVRAHRIAMCGGLLLCALMLAGGCGLIPSPAPTAPPVPDAPAPEQPTDDPQGVPEPDASGWVLWLLHPVVLLRALGGLTIMFGVAGALLSIKGFWTRMQPVESLMLVPLGVGLALSARIVRVLEGVVDALVWPVTIGALVIGGLIFVMWVIDATDAIPRIRAMWGRIRGLQVRKFRT